jgi:hypothetical protein
MLSHGGSVLLVTFHGTCVAVEPNFMIHANRVQPQPSDAFTITLAGNQLPRDIKYGDAVNLRAALTGKFLTAEHDCKITAYQDVPQLLETFTVVDPSNPYDSSYSRSIYAGMNVAFRTCHFRFLCAERNSFFQWS